MVHRAAVLWLSVLLRLLWKELWLRRLLVLLDRRYLRGVCLRRDRWWRVDCNLRNIWLLVSPCLRLIWVVCWLRWWCRGRLNNRWRRLEVLLRLLPLLPMLVPVAIIRIQR